MKKNNGTIGSVKFYQNNRGITSPDSSPDWVESASPPYYSGNL
ncbi:hypothetical protein [Echinicola salinicaeni]|nr:hypothetical protein [Echinicola salinicaeni]